MILKRLAYHIPNPVIFKLVGMERLLVIEIYKIKSSNGQLVTGL